jgi:hypothetical protein
MAYIIMVLALITGLSSAQSNETTANHLAIGQGVSSPTLTSTINFSSGYTDENPVGVIYQDGLRLTGEYDQNGTKAYGGELGYGKKSWGIAGGYRKRDCNNCEGDAAGAVALSIGDVGFGIRFAEDLYAVGLLFNSHGKHRLGFMAELHDSDGSNNNITSFGAGYSYINNQITLTIDASKRTYESTAIRDDTVLVTPGLMLRADILQVSVNDRITVNNTTNNTAPRTTTNDPQHDFWFGIGVGDKNWHIAAYSDYVNEFALAASLFF